MNKALRRIGTWLGRVERNIGRRIKDNEALREVFRRPLFLASRVREQRKNQRERKVNPLPAPEVECTGKGKAHKPCEFGAKACVAAALRRSKGGKFAAHMKALPGSLYDGLTLANVIPETENKQRFKVYTCKNPDLIWRALCDEAASRHSSLGGECGERSAFVNERRRAFKEPAA